MELIEIANGAGGETIKLYGFQPVADVSARVLILGSLPSAISIARGEYYANPRNVFWRIMECLVGASVELPYPERTRKLKENGVALWDVCAAGERPGSLDSSIQGHSVDPNDFASFLTEHPSIRLICFNGATALKLYHRLVLPQLAVVAREISQETLPSTSPAHAAMSFDQKLMRWRVVLGDR